MKQVFTGWKSRIIICTILLLILAGSANAQKKSKSKSKTSTPVQMADPNAISKEKIEAALNEAYDKFKDLKEGKNADYIKELANVDPNIFGIALVTADVQVN